MGVRCTFVTHRRGGNTILTNGSGAESLPILAGNAGNGRYLLVWQDSRTDTADIYSTAGTNLQTTVIDYQYDSLSRLTTATYTGVVSAAYTHAYDAVGNMTAYTETVGITTTIVTRAFDNANQLQTAFDSAQGTTSYYYDSNGDLVQILPPGTNGNNLVGVLRYGYDQRHLLITNTLYISGTGWVEQATFVYDGDGNRVQQVDSSRGQPITTTYSNDNSGLSQMLVSQVVSGGVVTTTTNLFGLSLISQDTGAAVRTLLADGLGSARTEMRGSVVETITTYEPFGNLLAQTGSSGTVYGFTGQQYDNATSLLYLRARYYSPGLRVFMSKDPWSGNVQQPGTLNPYVYVLNNPTNLTDPTGKWCFYGFSFGPGRGCTPQQVARFQQIFTFISGLPYSPAFATGFIYEFADTISVTSISTTRLVMEWVFQETVVGQVAAISLGITDTYCGVPPEVVQELLTPYSSLVNNPDPYFQFGRAAGRLTALALGIGEATGGGGATFLEAVGAVPSGGATLVASPATAALAAHGVAIATAVSVKERTDPLITRLGVLFSAAVDATGGGGNGGSGKSAKEILMDEHPNLTSEVADAALEGPSGTSPRAKGAGGQGADVDFVDGNDNVVLSREVKVVDGNVNSFNTQISYAANKQINLNGEIYVQVPADTDANSWITRFRGRRTPSDLAKYSNVSISIFDPSANLLFSGSLAPKRFIIRIPIDKISKRKNGQMRSEMGTDIHIYVEYDETGDPPFSGVVIEQTETERQVRGVIKSFSEGQIYLSRDYRLFAALGGIKTDEMPLYIPRGLPKEFSEAVILDYYLPVVDIDEDDLWSNENHVQRQAAIRWVERGLSHFIDSGLKPHGLVSKPDYHTPSWLTLIEIRQALVYKNIDTQTLPPDFQVLLVLMETLETHIGEGRTRLVFWFDN